MLAIPSTLRVVFKCVCVSLNISGNFLPKKRLAINKNKYWLPCKELTNAGVAKETEKVIKSSDMPPQACPDKKIIPDLENNEKELSFPLKTILRLTGISTIKIPTGARINLDQTKTVKKFACKYASLKKRYETANKIAERNSKITSLGEIFPIHSKIVKKTRPRIKIKTATISISVTLFE